ncbi:hypothetical protein CS0771_63070 [Catellatospora sp. IY07-71]|uniref:hypothetical protein n=1 Tax=Catellatospora sp. IY07-71 TaxID=2728827 RepID=UPI001BB41775|nr:hypothetical protein [Catellatospora sp. IY07-71]BCJ76763.1 hypothetical protein CS0771_63070 [Catellatospora sp. IY07-71]
MNGNGWRAERVLAGGIAAGLVMTALIGVSGWWLARPDFLPDTGPSWYVWQLPERSTLIMAGVWGLYALHQVGFWALIWYGRQRVGTYTKGLHRVNAWALAFNGVFVLLHFAQTQLWYDALAQDVSIWSSQFSVIILLVWVLLMESDRRGLFFGRTVPTPGGAGVRAWARKYHGYYFAWAAVYTFWYHPMETTAGHLVGFLYMFLILLQGSLFLTRAHVNRWWTVTLELAVLFHGAIVALNSPKQLWFQFGWGFATIFVITQMHGLGLPRWAKWLIGSAYVVSAGVVVSLIGPHKLAELPRVPAAEYVGVFILAAFFALALWIARRLRPTPSGAGPKAEVSGSAPGMGPGGRG